MGLLRESNSPGLLGTKADLSLGWGSGGRSLGMRSISWEITCWVRSSCQDKPWDMSCRSTPCKRWRTGEVTCKRGRACPAPAWHCPNKPS